MCGISGIISKTNSVSLKDAAFAMNRAIKHRGPDGEGFAFFTGERSIPAYSNETPQVNKESRAFLYNPVVALENIEQGARLALAHRRLSIIDLSEAGHQPMCDTNDTYWITFNGEIFNYIELREQLKAKGHVFITQTDTEVILAAYKEWGVDCLQKFNGMFAFALFDRTRNHLFCARDRAGVKPFYYINTAGCFAFASEYKAFIRSKLMPFEINEAEQFDFLVNANLETATQSLFKGINELKPSCYFVYDLSSHNFEIKKYYSISDTPALQKSDAELIQLIEEKLVNAINLRLRSDVEIGSCLSGGLDSSIIAGVVKHLQPAKQMKLFTAVFPDEAFDESAYAKLVAQSVNGNWQTVSPTADEFFRDIKELNYSQDLPVWSTSTYSQHRVMKLASDNHIKVLLDGQGADELFAGYSHHYMALWKEMFHKAQFGKAFRSMSESKGTVPNACTLFARQLLKDNLGLSVDYAAYFVEGKKSAGKSVNQKIAGSLNQQLKLDYKGRLKSFLKCEDRCSMAFGIESRVPFADDVELVDLIFSIHGQQKIQQGISKYLLREAAKKYIPARIYERKDKIGFETPVAGWFRAYKEQVLDTITGTLDFMDTKTLVADFDTLLAAKPSFLLRLYSLAIWHEAFKNS
jgi:asparagine synthase (glutamine-hydrolysing)